MATTNRGLDRSGRRGGKTPAGRGVRRRLPLTAVIVVLLALFVAGWYWRAPLFGYARAGAAYGAHTACACRHIGGRELGDCRKDFVPGMEVVFLSEDAEARTVTARVPLLANETARYSEGRGCVLEPWDG